MADAKYSELPLVTNQLTTSVFGVEENGVSKGTTIAQIQGGATTGAVSFIGSTGIFTQDSSNLFYDSLNTSLGLGTNAPEGGLHVSRGVPSTVNPSSQADTAIFQSDGDTGLTIFGPDNKVMSLVLGSPGGIGNEGARIRWNPTANLLNIVTTETGADILIAPGFLAESIRFKANGQIGIGTNVPNAASKLDIVSTTQGFMPPRWTNAEETTNVGSLGASNKGLMWFNTTSNQFKGWNGTSVVIMA